MTRLMVAAALALPLLGACVEVTEPRLGGDYLGSVQSPNSAEGVALLNLTRAGVQSLSAPGRVLVGRAIGADSVRVLVINDPSKFIGGPISFIARMAEGQRPPGGEVLQAAGPANRHRLTVSDYRVHFTRAQVPQAGLSALRAPAGGPALAVDENAISFQRAAGVFLGDAQQALTAEERQWLDQAGNGNGGYDVGDLRAFLFRHPARVPTTSSWTP